MENFTYEKNLRNSPLETYEWDNVWWEQTENASAKRVAYIGDSISCGIRNIATATSNNTIMFDGFGTSKAVDNPFFKSSLQLFFSQQYKTDAILFNNGLHGWHLSEAEYENGYRGIISFIKENTDAPIFIILTTNDASDNERNERVKARNTIAGKIASEYGFPVINLYELSEKYTNLHIPDGVHFSNEGYTILAKAILEAVKEKI